MKTVVVGPRPPELDEMIARRQALGQDTYDEVWEGDYHMVPAPHPRHGYVVAELIDALGGPARRAGLIRTDPFNLGTSPQDFRVPDIGLHAELPGDAFVPTAVFIVEVPSPGDESWDKFDFYAARGVGEVLIADPASATLSLFVLDGDRYRPADASPCLGVTVAELAAAVRWLS